MKFRVNLIGHYYTSEEVILLRPLGFNFISDVGYASDRRYPFLLVRNPEPVVYVQIDDIPALMSFIRTYGTVIVQGATDSIRGISHVSPIMGGTLEPTLTIYNERL